MATSQTAGLINQLRNAWRGIAHVSRYGRALRADLPDADREALRRQMRECLEGRGGEVSARGRAAALGEAYLNLSETGRERFLRLLAEDFGVDRAALYRVAQELTEVGDPAAHLALEARLRRTLAPPRLKLLTQFNALPRGSSSWSTCAPTCCASRATTRRSTASTTICAGCCAPGSTSAFSFSRESRGRRRRRSWKSSCTTRPCTRSAPGTTSRTG